MTLPGNGIFVVQGEMAMLVTAMRRSTRWGSHSFPNEEYDVLMRTFQDLKNILNQVDDLRLLDPATYLGPFLEVIRSKETTGPVTSLALSAIHKFLSYGLIDPTHPSVPATVEDIAEAVTHARFVGTDHSSDGVVLMKILQVLRTLMLSPEGVMLTDESVCEIMLSCFRICFESRLTELLRRNAEQCLRDMTQLVFMRLPQFADDACGAGGAGGGAEMSLKKRDKVAKKKTLAHVNSSNSLDRKSSMTDTTTDKENETETDSKVEPMRNNQDAHLINEREITIEPVESASKPARHARHSSMDLAQGNSISQLLEKCVNPEVTVPEPKEEVTEKEEGKEEKEVKEEEAVEPPAELPTEAPTEADGSAPSAPLQEYVSPRGIRFTQREPEPELQPYGVGCVRELFRFLISLCNPLEQQNSSGMVHLGLSLVGVALEVAADTLPGYPSLLHLVKDPLARNLLTLLSTERISIFALDLQVSFLLFESMRYHLKYQMEAYFKKIIEIISSDTTKAIYELKEIHHLALESLIQFFKIPGLCTELYLNYDCDVYCMNVFEELTKLLSKNVVSSTAYNIHQLSLEALLTVLEEIEFASQMVKDKCEDSVERGEEEGKYGRGGHVTLELGGLDDASVASEPATHDISQYYGARRAAPRHPSAPVPSEAELDNIRNIKKWVTQGTELFNQKPEAGIVFLQQHGVLGTPLDPREVAVFLRENPDLDKKMIGEYICKRSSRGEEDDGPSVLGAFADSFDYAGLRIEQALRLYLETFRLPGEAPLIFLVMERFAERWHTTNGEPFANTDAAFRLAYAVIMLNMDQHNHNAKKLNVPMTVEDFVKNLRGCNGSGDFDQKMLEEVFYSIKNEEMVMPAERVGPVRDAYLWRVLQRRGAAAGARYRAARRPHQHHARLFAVCCPPTVTALSAAFERSSPPTPEEIESNNTRESPALVALRGLERCAALVARLPADSITVDTLLLTLCKFTGLLAPQHAAYIAIGVTLGQSPKSQLALRRACAVAARHADCVRAAWRHLMEIVNTLYIGRLLPKSMVEAEDYLNPAGTVSLIRDTSRGNEAGLLSSIYSYIALGESGVRAPTPHEKSLIETATECVARCNLPALLVRETRFLHVDSLQELVRAMVAAGAPPDADSLQLNPQLEDIVIFFMELLGQTLIQNRDRLQSVWDEAGPHLRRVVHWAAHRGPYTLTRALTALLRTAARLMRCDQCAPAVLHHLTLLFALPYKMFYQQATVISCGLYELVKTSAQNVHSAAEWEVVFALLCAAGAGAWPNERPEPALSATSSRSEGSEDEGERRPQSASSESELSQSPHTHGWILVKNELAPSSTEPGLETVTLRPHVAAALARCCEALALVVRDVAHVTPHNCRAAVRAVRLFARATLHAGKKSSKSSTGRKSRPSSARRRDRSDSSDEEIDTLDQYHMVSIQLLDLMHTLHSRTAQIFKWWRDEAEHEGAEDYDLWEVAWKPLLQGIAQFCTDRRKQVANSAIAYLQRALLVPGLAACGGAGWEACFQSVLFPLLEQLPRRAAVTARADTIMCKVFLQHLSALCGRASFAALWARVVAVQRALITAAPPDDPLTEAALESLKNMILVMDSVRIFSTADGSYNELWYMTWSNIDEFLPHLKEELFPQVKDNSKPPSLPHHMHPPVPASLPTIVPVPNSNRPPTSPPTLAQTQPMLAQTQPMLAQTQPMLAQTQPMLAQTQPMLAQTQPMLAQMSPQAQQMLAQTQLISPQSQPTLAQTSTYNQSAPILVPSSFVQTSSPMFVPTLAHSPVNISQTPPQSIVAPTPINAPIAVVNTPVIGGVNTVMGMPISGMVPIRNPLYDQPPLTSSVLLQPLNEMKSTPIGISIQPQPTPILCPQTEPEPSKTEPTPTTIELTIPPNTLLQLNYEEKLSNIEQGELYAEYLTNPYNETKEVSAKEATLYDPSEVQNQNTDTQPYLNSEIQIQNPLLEKQKSFSANATPMHRNKAQFGSTDNVSVRQESSIFNFSSYFGAVNEKSSEVFDTLMSSQDG